MLKGESGKRKKSAAKAEIGKNSGPRIRKATRRQTRTRAKKELHERAPLPGSFKLVRIAFTTIAKFWKPLSGIVVVYSLLNLVLASTFLDNVSTTLVDVQKNTFSDATSLYGDIISNSSGSSSSFLQSVLFILETLVIVWALRHLMAGQKIKIKDAYYLSMAPLIPFLLVVLVIVLELIPLSISGLALGIILSNSFAQSALIGAIFGAGFVLLGALSLYLLSSSVFAAYVVTLPNMHPRYALKSAKNLVKYRRFAVLRKMLFLPICILFIMGVIIIPLIMYASFLVTPVYFILNMVAVLFGHTYLYSLYKGLLA